MPANRNDSSPSDYTFGLVLAAAAVAAYVIGEIFGPNRGALAFVCALVGFGGTIAACYFAPDEDDGL